MKVWQEVVRTIEGVVKHFFGFAHSVLKTVAVTLSVFVVYRGGYVTHEVGVISWVVVFVKCEVLMVWFPEQLLYGHVTGTTVEFTIVLVM